MEIKNIFKLFTVFLCVQSLCPEIKEQNTAMTLLETLQALSTQLSSRFVEEDVKHKLWSNQSQDLYTALSVCKSPNCCD